LSDAHWVHQVLIGMAVPISLWAVLRSGHWRRASVGLPMLVGLGLLGVAAFYALVEIYEVPLSVSGAAMLAFAHYRNTRLTHSRAHRH
jgi:MerC mercury resistance protein